MMEFYISVIAAPGKKTMVCFGTVPKWILSYIDRQEWSGDICGHTYIDENLDEVAVFESRDRKEVKKPGAKSFFQKYLSNENEQKRF